MTDDFDPDSLDASRYSLLYGRKDSATLVEELTQPSTCLRGVVYDMVRIEDVHGRNLLNTLHDKDAVDEAIANCSRADDWTIASTVFEQAMKMFDAMEGGYVLDVEREFVTLDDGSLLLYKPEDMRISTRWDFGPTKSVEGFVSPRSAVDRFVRIVEAP